MYIIYSRFPVVQIDHLVSTQYFGIKINILKQKLTLGTCVKAFTKLEGSLESIPECRVQEYKRLAESIFSKYTSEDTKREMVKCYACNSPLLERLTSILQFYDIFIYYIYIYVY